MAFEFGTEAGSGRKSHSGFAFDLPNKCEEPKRVLLRKVLGRENIAEEVRKMPQILGCSYQRLSSRSKVLVKRNETQKLRNAMVLTEDRFRAKYICAKKQKETS